jgi:type IV pilus assembly protein PilW
MKTALDRPTAGFTLVEVMVAMVIGLVAMLAVMQTLALTESQKRSVISGVDAQTGSVIGLYLLERDLRMAGYGMANNADSGLLGVCGFGTVNAYNTNRLPVTAAAFSYDGAIGSANYLPFVPIAINPAGIPAGDAGTDVVLVNYGGSFGMVSDRAIVTVDNATGIKVTDRSGFQNGDLIMVAALAPGNTCAMAEVTDLPNSSQCGAGSGDSGVIVHAAGNYNNYWMGSPLGAGCPSTAARFNDASTGLASGTYVGGRVFNLGAADKMASHVYAVRNGALTMCDMLTHDCTAAGSVNDESFWQRIAPGIVFFRTEIDNAGVWGTAPPATRTAWMGINAARVVLVSRSDQFEKNAIAYSASSQPSNAGAITWAGGTLDATTIPNWDHYRYKVVETRIPLRNLIGAKNIPESPAP